MGLGLEQWQRGDGWVGEKEGRGKERNISGYESKHRKDRDRGWQEKRGLF